MTQVQPPKQRLSGTDIVLALFLPYVALPLAAFRISRPESRERGYGMLAISLVVGATCWVAWGALFGSAIGGFGFLDRLFALYDRITEPERAKQWLPWAFVAVVAVPVTTIYLVLVRRQASGWRRLAARTGLAYRPSGCLSTAGPRVAGTYRGRQLDLYRYTPAIEDTLDVTCIELRVSNPGAGHLRLEHTPVGRAIGTLLKPQGQLGTGDEAFDRQFEIDCRPPPLAASVLASLDLRQRLLHLRELTTIKLEDGVLSLERSGLEGDEAYLRFAIDLLCDLADAVESTGREG